MKREQDVNGTEEDNIVRVEVVKGFVVLNKYSARRLYQVWYEDADGEVRNQYQIGSPKEALTETNLGSVADVKVHGRERYWVFRSLRPIMKRVFEELDEMLDWYLR